MRLWSRCLAEPFRDPSHLLTPIRRWVSKQKRLGAGILWQGGGSGLKMVLWVALEAKAPGLWNLAHGDGVEFEHVSVGGSAFLADLRVALRNRYRPATSARWRCCAASSSRNACRSRAHGAAFAF